MEIEQRRFIDVKEEGKFRRLTYIPSCKSKNIFCYSTISHVVFELSNVNMPTEQEIRLYFKGKTLWDLIFTLFYLFSIIFMSIGLAINTSYDIYVNWLYYKHIL